jgi:hypothetical protein
MSNLNRILAAFSIRKTGIGQEPEDQERRKTMIINNMRFQLNRLEQYPANWMGRIIRRFCALGWGSFSSALVYPDYSRA